MLRTDTIGHGQDYLRSTQNVEVGGVEKAKNEITAQVDRQEEVNRPRPRRIGAKERISRTLQRANTAIKGAAVKGVAVALLLGAMATSAFAQQTEITKPVPLKPVAVQAALARGDPVLMDRLTAPRTGSDLTAHLERAKLINPFIASIQIPNEQDPLSAEVRNFVWRLVARSMHQAEAGPDYTNLMPTTPVDGELMWRAKIKDRTGKELDVLPMIMPQLARPDGSLDMDKVMLMFSRVNNPAPAASESNVFLATNPGFKNGRAAYFPLDAINPEPLQPSLANGSPTLPQFVVTLPNGSKVVHTIGALCVKGNGPSFLPDGSGWYGGDDYANARKKTPLNEEVRRPIYSGNSTFGLFDYEADAKTNEYGWQLRDRGAYTGVSIAHIKLKQLVDYRLDADGKPTGSPVAISIQDLKSQGRVSSSAEPSLIWRAFSTEYRLSAYKSPTDGVAVYDQVRAIFARDAIFTHIANTPALQASWTRATEAYARGDTAQMPRVWNEAIAGLNRDIAAGKSHLKHQITVKDGIAQVTADDFVNEAVHRGARNVVIFNDLGLVHHSIAVGGDNINAAFEVVDNDDLNSAGNGQAKGDPRTHQNIQEYSGNIEDAIKALSGKVPELKPYEGKVRDMLLEQIDKEAAIYGAVPGRG